MRRRQFGRTDEALQVVDGVMSVLALRQRVHQRSQQRTPHRSGHALVEGTEFQPQVALVAAEQFVTSQPGERDRHMSPRELANIVGGDHGVVRKRFIEGLDDLVEHLFDVWLNFELGVGGSVALTHEPGEGPLVHVPAARAPKTNRERLHRSRGALAHQSDDQTGIDAPAQERAERDIAHQVRRDGVSEELDESVSQLRLIRAHIWLKLEAPVLLDRDPVPFQHDHVTWLELPDLRVNRPRSWNVPECEVIVQRLNVEVHVEDARSHQRLDLGTEEQAAVLHAVEQGLDAEPIARDDQPLLGLVPQGEREHSPQLPDELFSCLFV